LRRGGITKAGNAHARRALIEGAWTYRMPARVSRKLYDRLESLPPEICEIAWKPQVRLCCRWRRLVALDKPKVVTTAIAREMVDHLGDRPPGPAAGGRLSQRRVFTNSGEGQTTTIALALTAGGRITVGTLATCYEPAEPMLAPRTRQPKTKPRSCGRTRV
jgi:hypothetical protein